MTDGDLRALLDPIAAILAARPRYRIVPESTYQPPPTDIDPNPPPVVTPARTELFVPVDDLPDEATANGGVDLSAQLALLQSALAWIWDKQQIRRAESRYLLTGTQQAGAVLERDLTWSSPPEKVPTSGAVTVTAPISWLGRTVASVKPGTLTATGCTLRIQVLQTVSPQSTDPIVYDVAGTYLWVPPYEGGAP